MNTKPGLTIMVLLIAHCLNAQHVNFGLKVGLNVFNIQNDNSTTYDPKAGLNAGLIGHIHLSRHFALQPELIYSQKGAKFTVANVDRRLKLNYLNIPILFQFMFNNGFRIQAGPEIGILLQAKQKTGNTNLDVKDDLKLFDLGLAAGVSYVHPPTGFGIDLRYVKGLVNINSEGTETSKNQGFQVGVFYLLKHR